MTSRELVSKTICGENPGRTPVYGWVRENLSKELTEEFGSVENFEDKYEFDMAHIFGGPAPFNTKKLDELRDAGEEVTPDVVLDLAMNPVSTLADYDDVKKQLNHYQTQRDRFCYMQTNGIFECVNGVFGIEEHMVNMMLYPDEMKEIYARLAEWNKQFSNNIIDLGMDMVHVSDDWGAQNSLMFSKEMLKEMIYPYHKAHAESVKARNTFLSLHSDGNINAALDVILDIGYDVVHPWQESAGMSYQTYLDNYQDKFGILGGLCIQMTLGFGKYDLVKSELERVFGLLKNKRWMFCTSHFVQDHCSIEELCFAFDHAVKLARG